MAKYHVPACEGVRVSLIVEVSWILFSRYECTFFGFRYLLTPMNIVVALLKTGADIKYKQRMATFIIICTINVRSVYSLCHHIYYCLISICMSYVMHIVQSFERNLC